MLRLYFSISFIWTITLIYGQVVHIGEYNVYYGHLHNHTNYSDGSGTPDQAYSYARNIAGLDFLGISDHALMLSDSEYSNTINAANAHNKDGVFAAFYGFEWTSNSYGHVTVVGCDSFCTSNTEATNTYSKFLDWLINKECIAFLNHPGRQDGSGNEFNHFTNAPLENIVGIELWNKTTGFYRYYYNDGYYKNDNNLNYYEEGVHRGWRLGASGSDDNHAATWGNRSGHRLAILADTLSREALYEAMKERRFYSTEDKGIAMSFSINCHEMGSLIKSVTAPLHIQAYDANNEIFTKAILYKNGIEFKTWKVDSTLISIQELINVKSGDVYYVKITQYDKNEAISSPIWVND